MSAHTGNRRTNFAQFMQDLQAPTQASSPDDTLLDEDLAMFTNTFSSDWDTPAGTDFGAALKVNGEAQSSAAGGMDTSSGAFDFSLPSTDELNNFDWQFASPVQSYTDSLGNLQPLQPSPTGNFAPNPQQPHFPVPQPQPNNKRAAIEPAPGQVGFEEQSRHAAEEDKRKRNTAASARFRVKKKAREQALEKREKELSDEVSQMKNRITHLETENKWLRGLVMEKAGAAKDTKFDARLSALLKTMGKESSPESEAEEAKVPKVEAAEKTA